VTARQVIKVLVADDDRGVLAVVRLALKTHSDIEIIAEAKNGREAVALAIEHKPDVVIMDFEMPYANGIEATKGILPTLPATRVLLFTANSSQEVIDAAFGAGVTGFLEKSASSELATAIRSVVQGRLFMGR
jgi:DNA-binding NarL/FixJ family response regulator